jgi:uncharacterized protein (DUF983 family)
MREGSPRAGPGAVLWRGLRKRCPHCGHGRLFSGFAHHLERCAACGLVYERNPGDTWAFTVVGDRLPIALIIAVLYLGMRHMALAVLIAAFVLAGVAIVATAPNRWGVGIALHYLSRRRWPDPSDPIPND